MNNSKINTATIEEIKGYAKMAKVLVDKNDTEGLMNFLNSFSTNVRLEVFKAASEIN